MIRWNWYTTDSSVLPHLLLPPMKSGHPALSQEVNHTSIGEEHCLHTRIVQVYPVGVAEETLNDIAERNNTNVMDLSDGRSWLWKTFCGKDGVRRQRIVINNNFIRPNLKQWIIIILPDKSNYPEQEFITRRQRQQDTNGVQCNGKTSSHFAWHLKSICTDKDRSAFRGLTER